MSILPSLRSLTVTRKFGLFTVGAILGIALITALFLVSERELLLKERQGSIQQNVETAYGVLTYYHDLATKGTLTDEQAKLQALAAVRGMRYNGTDYFWVNDMQPRMLMHPISTALEGKDLSENKDPTGKHLFVEFVNTVKASGAGFVPYLWPKPGSDKPVQKVSYVKGFAPWGWIIGSGVYVDTVNAAIMQRSVTFAGSAVILAVVMSVLGWILARSLLQQLGGEPAYASVVTARIAQGDLTVPVELKSGDDSSLLHAIQTMRDSIAGIVGQVRSGTDSIATASAEIAQGNNDLSRRTEQQAAALEETAASMEQLSSTVKQNADNARQGNQLAMSASAVAVKGGDVVGQVVETMKGINDASRKISDIIGVIDSIAFQTNILALNAAVEAARAGEQGRGFAVVASEVRSLAGRSADAAKEIKSLINASVERVEQGTTLVDQAGATMTEVVTAIRRVTDLMGEISAASSEQSTGVGQVGEAITQMDQATQQNAALVEESAAAAESLRGQAQTLVQAVAVFKLGAGDSPGQAAPVLRAPQQSMVSRPATPPTHAAPVRPHLSARPMRKAIGAPSAPPAKAAAAGNAWTSF